jgi:hypothetical protein
MGKYGQLDGADRVRALLEAHNLDNAPLKSRVTIANAITLNRAEYSGELRV